MAPLEDIVSLCKRRGFIFQGSEIYGGLAGTWDYGPLGVTLKRNIINLWWKMFVEDRDDMFGVDAAILMNKQVWEASGHATGFNDPMVECQKCKTLFRADQLFDEVDDETQKASDESSMFYDKTRHLLEKYKTPAGLVDYPRIEKEEPECYKEILKAETASQKVDEGMFIDMLRSNSLEYALSHIKCPSCDSEGTFSKPRQFNMMFKTSVGPVEDESSVSYLRPETAQGIFTNFKNVVDSIYPDFPFGMAQVGKAFRNEISPRDFIFRGREFEQMEIEYFVEEKDWEKQFDAWKNEFYKWFEAIGLPKNMVHELDVPEGDRAHYSKKTIDFEFDFPFGKSELYGLAYRTDFDLKNHEKSSGKKLAYTPKEGGRPFTPHVIEPTFGIDRTILAVLTACYKEDEVNGEKRSYLALPHALAPIQYVVSPLVKNKPELVKKAREVYGVMKKKYGAVLWDDNANVGKRYRRADEIGVPKCVTIDFDTLEDDTVTVRDRDTTKQNRIKIDSI